MGGGCASDMPREGADSLRSIREMLVIIRGGKWTRYGHGAGAAPRTCARWRLSETALKGDARLQCSGGQRFMEMSFGVQCGCQDRRAFAPSLRDVPGTALMAILKTPGRAAAMTGVDVGRDRGALMLCLCTSAIPGNVPAA